MTSSTVVVSAQQSRNEHVNHQPTVFVDKPLPRIQSHYEVPSIEEEVMEESAYYAIPPGPSSSEQIYDVPTITEENSIQFNKLSEELLSTEERYLGDLLLAKKLFYDNLIKLPYRNEVETIFRHWDQLIDVSRKVYVRLKRCDSPGNVFISEIDSLSVFVAFCSHQQVALDALNQLIAHPDAQQLYAKCTASIAARGMSLSTFLLMPLGRVTRYPLLIEKIFKECDPHGDLHQELDTALQLLRALVSEVNRAVTEEENIFLLCWAQSHVKCPASLKLEFTSNTRLLGLRSFLHSGVLYKQRSGRLLVALLFNDFLMLTTPDEHLSEPNSFKISKTTEKHFTLYKQPMLLSNLKVLPSNDETTLNLKHGNDTVCFRCTNGNARRLWTSQLEQAIDLYAITVSEQEHGRKSSANERIIGRLLIEVMNMQNVRPKILDATPHILRLSLGKSTEMFDVDLSKKSDLHLTTQFPFETTSLHFTIALLHKNLYSPDVPLLEERSVALGDLLRESSYHRGPLIKPIHLRRDIRDKSKPVETVTVKFVVNMFDENM